MFSLFSKINFQSNYINTFVFYFLFTYNFDCNSGGTNPGIQQTQQTTVPVHQHILSLATSPYGDNPIFKDLKPFGSMNEDALKPTNPAAQKAILESSSSQFKVSPKITNGLKVKPVGSTLSKV